MSSHDPHTGEVKAALLAVQKMTDLGLKKLIIEGYSLVVVHTIQHRHLPLDWQIGPIIQNIHSLLSKTFS